MIADVLRALEGRGLKRSGAGWAARCPAHDDRDPSLAISQGDDGRVLLCCHAGCATAEVLKAAGLDMAALFPEKETTGSARRIVATYDYRDEGGALLYQVVRYDGGKPRFQQRRPDGSGGWMWSLGDVRRVPYRLPELVAANPSATVFVPEGEKDVDNLVKLGLVATCNPGGAGAGKWRPEFNEMLRGRRVVVLPDNDDVGRDHARAVATSLKSVAASVRILELPGLPPGGGDVSDWIASGGTRDQLLDLVRPATGFRRASDRIAGEREERLELAGRLLPFSVEYLNRAMLGLTPHDLLLLFAKTGIGKTALATMMALHACKQGRQVYFYALEAEHREIERRMKYEVLSQHYFQVRPAGSPSHIRYLDWFLGKLDDVLGPYEDWADQQLKPVFENLHTYYKTDSFSAEDFCRTLEVHKDEADLVVVDHLHYIDSDDPNENRGYRETVKRIRDTALSFGLPVTAVAHVRKSDRRMEGLLPVLEDIHGSSDIMKVATKAVVLAPAYDQPSAEKFLWPTYLQVAKCRLDSSLTRHVALCTFNARLNAYMDAFELGRLVDGGKKFEPVPFEQWPHWARGR